MEPRTDPKAHERQLFAKQLAAELEQAAQAGRFEELVLVAEPTMLGELRSALSGKAAASVRHEIGKDFAGLSLHELQQRLLSMLLVR